MSHRLGDSRVRTEGFERLEYAVGGNRTVVYAAGSGEPLVYFHGAGTFHGLDYARDWIDRYRVIIPYHPGFGESPDDPRITTIHDYVLHYLELFGLMGISNVNLVGCSMGGRLAAEFAVEHSSLLRRLVLVCPAGLDAPDYPMADLAEIPAGELLSYLISDIRFIERYLPTGPDPHFAAMRDREGASVGRILRAGSLVNPLLSTWLHRVQVPSLVVWGSDDRLIPAAQANIWSRLLPHCSTHMVPGGGHLILDESADARLAVKSFLAKE
ncbi:alpha/beta fold hydrolase (plasmid) [Agrobacterium leguminum]|uniref:alpha/beta fold hydrolase n=1 Tax=Agrobacterium leguminum TaxID=2792015 RepID=UPI0030CF4E00